jgi:lipoate-protein ligase A
MSSHPSGRLILHPPGEGAWNMSVDESLGESAGRDPTFVLRFYAWTEPTLSLGYFQAAEDRNQHFASRNCPLVRRASGGGAIVHDREITYSLVVPITDTARPPAPLYRLVHEGLIRALAAQGIAGAAMAGNAPPGDEKPFLCFARRSGCDVVLRGAKIAGSAQRKHRGAILQHGSVLLSRSAAAPELPGIRDVAGPCDESQLIADWQREIAHALGLEFSPGDLSSEERQRVEELWQEKYVTDAWNHRR